MEQDIPKWLKWARELQSLSQTGLTFARNPYEVERNKRLAEIASEILELHTGLEREKLIDDFTSQPGYATPKIDVRGAVLRDGQILLVKERSDQKWCMPGGWVDVGEAPARAVAREVHEESGFKVEVKKVIAVLDANRSGRPLSLYHAFKIIFQCEIIGGKARQSHETGDVNFFDFANVPELSENRTNHKHLREVKAHRDDPNRPTAFD